MRFNEIEVDGNVQWLIKKDACLHCEEPGCLFACPAPGAIVQYTNGIVDFNQDNCIGCQYCVTGCPFDIPRYDASTKLGVEVQHVHRPGRRRSGTGLRKDMSHETRSRGAPRKTCWRSPIQKTGDAPASRRILEHASGLQPLRGRGART